MQHGLFVKGLIVGFCLAAPVGPIALLCVQRTLSHGKLAGLLSGLGAAVADALYGTLAAFGVTVISSFLMDHRMVFQRVGGAVLCVLGVRLFLSRAPTAAASDDVHGLARDFFSTLVLTLTNPMTFIAFVAIFATLGIGAVRGHSILTAELVGGVLLGSGAWFAFLVGLANLFRDRFRASTLVALNRATGVFVVGVGIVYLFILRPQSEVAPKTPAEGAGGHRGPRPVALPLADLALRRGPPPASRRRRPEQTRGLHERSFQGRVDPRAARLREREPRRAAHFLGLRRERVGPRRQEEAHVEVHVLGPVRARRDAVHVHVEHARAERRFEILDAGLLARLAPRRVEDRCVLRFDVAAGLEPAVEPPVVHEEEGVPVWPRHHGARRDVIAHGAREGIGRVLQQGADPGERFLFGGTLSRVGREPALQVPGQDHLRT